MKNYNRVILAIVICYIALASFLGYKMFTVDQQASNTYRVEVNRIMSQFGNDGRFYEMDLQNYNYVQRISFLDSSSTDAKLVKQFYKEENNQSQVIQPLYNYEGRILGYVKFIYQTSNQNLYQLFVMAEVALLILVIIITIVLFYVKNHIIQPFRQVQDLPIQIAKGNLKKEIKEEKNRYMGNFLWGLNQLKDTLEVSKKRQLMLLKEKKQLLLSLSHDIKTPLNLIKLYNKSLENDMFCDAQSKQNAYIQINKKVDEIEHYVDEIIKSSREDIIDIDVKNEEFYLEDLLERVVPIYQERCDVRNIAYKVHKFQNCLVKGDIIRSQEVLENILENALKYGDGRNIEISCYEEEYCQLIKISNTGGSLSDHEIVHVFDSFFRGANSMGKQGSGLGLYICQCIMQKMGGAIYAERLDEGMAFVVVFEC